MLVLYLKNYEKFCLYAIIIKNCYINITLTVYINKYIVVYFRNEKYVNVKIKNITLNVGQRIKKATDTKHQSDLEKPY